MRPGPLVVLALGPFGSAALAQQPPIVQLQYSADLPATFAPSATFALDHDYVIDVAGALYRVRLPGLPERADLDALHVEDTGDVLFSLDVGAVLDGAYYAPGDAIRYSRGAYTSAFDASSAGVPATANLDALARRNGRLIVSFDVAFTAGTFVRPGDALEVVAGQLGAKVLNAAAHGVATRLDVDALDALGTTTHLLVSFDTGGSVGGVTFADEDVLQLDLGAGTWTRRVAPAATSDRWRAANLDALAAAPNADALFKDGFEAGGPP